MDWEDLDERERQAAEDRAFEENPYGTGGDPDADYGYDYDAGSEATDVDYQPSDGGMSDEFTSYNNTDLYANQFGNGGDEDDADADGNDDEAENDADENEEGDDWNEDWDGDEDAEDEDELPEEDVQGVGDAMRNINQYQEGQVINIGGRTYKRENGHLRDLTAEEYVKKHGFEKYQKQQAKKKKKKPLNIDVPTFIELYPLVGQAQRKSKGKRLEIGQLWAQADKAIKSAIEGIEVEGPATMKIMKAYYKTKEALGMSHGGTSGDFDSVFIYDMIEIITSMGKTLTLTVILVVKALFDQAWQEATVAIFLHRILDQAIHKSQVRPILQKLFRLVIEAFEKDGEEAE